MYCIIKWVIFLFFNTECLYQLIIILLLFSSQAHLSVIARYWMNKMLLNWIPCKPCIILFLFFPFCSGGCRYFVWVAMSSKGEMRVGMLWDLSASVRIMMILACKYLKCCNFSFSYVWVRERVQDISCSSLFCCWGFVGSTGAGF